MPTLKQSYKESEERRREIIVGSLKKSSSIASQFVMAERKNRFIVAKSEYLGSFTVKKQVDARGNRSSPG